MCYTEDMEIEKGFYYHYKHDPAKEINDYAYEIMGIGHHTEVDGLDESAMVMYRPIYESSVYKAGKHWDLRPYDSFMEPVTKDDKTFPRFQKITDPEIVKKLEVIRNQMY